jgi:hypothetical protein
LLAALNDEYGDQGWDELRSLSRIEHIIAAREAAAEARGAQAVARAVFAGKPDDAFDARYRDGYAAAARAAAAAAAAAGGGA